MPCFRRLRNQVSEYTGILVVDKPAGWTSHDVVNKTRNMLSKVKVGHTGTLDPFATGVLVLLIGRATKQARLFADDWKSYDARITFGSATDTYDITGTVTDTGDPTNVDADEIARALETFRGDSMQTPPPFSAVKVNGKRLYKLAREGKQAIAEPRPITLSELSWDFSEYPDISVCLTCSKGTYIRSIAHELGTIVGCPAHLSALRRTRAGQFTIDDAIDYAAAVGAGDAAMLIDHLRPVPEQSEL